MITLTDNLLSGTYTCTSSTVRGRNYNRCS